MHISRSTPLKQIFPSASVFQRKVLSERLGGFADVCHNTTEYKEHRPLPVATWISNQASSAYDSAYDALFGDSSNDGRKKTKADHCKLLLGKVLKAVAKLLGFVDLTEKSIAAYNIRTAEEAPEHSLWVVASMGKVATNLFRYGISSILFIERNAGAAKLQTGANIGVGIAALFISLVSLIFIIRDVVARRTAQRAFQDQRDVLDSAVSPSQVRRAVEAMRQYASPATLALVKKHEAELDKPLNEQDPKKLKALFIKVEKSFLDDNRRLYGESDSKRLGPLVDLLRRADPEYVKKEIERLEEKIALLSKKGVLDEREEAKLKKHIEALAKWRIAGQLQKVSDRQGAAQYEELIREKEMNAYARLETTHLNVAMNGRHTVDALRAALHLALMALFLLQIIAFFGIAAPFVSPAIIIALVLILFIVETDVFGALVTKAICHVSGAKQVTPQTIGQALGGVYERWRGRDTLLPVSKERMLKIRQYALNAVDKEYGKEEVRKEALEKMEERNRIVRLQEIERFYRTTVKNAMEAPNGTAQAG